MRVRWTMKYNLLSVQCYIIMLSKMWKYCDGGMYRGELKGLYDSLSRTQAGPGRAVKQEQEEHSRNHITRLEASC